VKLQRDAEQRESLSTTMRTLRAENQKHTKDIARLEDKCTDAQRKLDIAETAEATAKTQLKSAESVIRGLKDDVARTKALVAQARSSCTTEVRRRDRQIDGLKKQLGEAGRARGARTNPAITTINVTGDVGSERWTPKKADSSPAAEDYSLRSETNDFLAKLAQSLSEENEAILGAMQHTMQQLREMSGWHPEDGRSGDGHVTKQPSWEDMAPEIEPILEHMKTILTNPSFVPIEEVMVREEEIARLKDGWVKMEDRWKDAVRLIDGWRKRMAASGRPVCDEELQMGLRLSPVRVQDAYKSTEKRDFNLSAVAEEEEEDVGARDPSPCPSADEEEESLDLVPAGDGYARGYPRYDEQVYEEAPSEHDGDDYHDYDHDDEDDGEGPNIEILQESTTDMPVYGQERDSSPMPEPPQLSPLRNSPSAGNRGPISPKKTRQKPGDFTTIVEENTLDLAGDDGPPTPPAHGGHLAKQPLPVGTPGERCRSPSRTSLDDILLAKTESAQAIESERREPRQEKASTPPRQQSPRRGASRLPLPRNAEATAPQQSPLTMATIAAKLAASEREADAARVRAKLKAVRGTRGVARPSTSGGGSSGGSGRSATPTTTASAETKLVKTRSGQGKEGQEDKGNAENVDPVKRDPATLSTGEQREEEPDQKPLTVEKRKRDRKTSKVSSRRRSTLSPWELESLISGTAE
jgi:hypothetical protein